MIALQCTSSYLYHSHTLYTAFQWSCPFNYRAGGGGDGGGDGFDCDVCLWHFGLWPTTTTARVCVYAYKWKWKVWWRNRPVMNYRTQQTAQLTVLRARWVISWPTPSLPSPSNDTITTSTGKKPLVVSSIVKLKVANLEKEKRGESASASEKARHQQLSTTCDDGDGCRCCHLPLPSTFFYNTLPCQLKTAHLSTTIFAVFFSSPLIAPVSAISSTATTTHWLYYLKLDHSHHLLSSWHLLMH